MAEVNDGPGGATRAGKDCQDHEPIHEDNENVGGPSVWVLEPVRVPVRAQIIVHVRVRAISVSDARKKPRVHFRFRSRFLLLEGFRRSNVDWIVDGSNSSAPEKMAGISPGTDSRLCEEETLAS